MMFNLPQLGQCMLAGGQGKEVKGMRYTCLGAYVPMMQWLQWVDPQE